MSERKDVVYFMTEIAETIQGGAASVQAGLKNEGWVNGEEKSVHCCKICMKVL